MRCEAKASMASGGGEACRSSLGISLSCRWRKRPTVEKQRQAGRVAEARVDGQDAAAAGREACGAIPAVSRGGASLSPRHRVASEAVVLRNINNSASGTPVRILHTLHSHHLLISQKHARDLLRRAHLHPARPPTTRILPSSLQLSSGQHLLPGPHCRLDIAASNLSPPIEAVAALQRRRLALAESGRRGARLTGLAMETA